MREFWKTAFAMLVIAILLLCASLAYVLIMRPAYPWVALPPVTPGQVRAALTIIPAPTSTPRPPLPTLTPFPPTPTASPTAAPGQIGVGVYVQISNTGGDGLNIRAEAGLNARVLFWGYDSEVFLVSGGPVQADGYTWWQLTASYDASRSGWAVQDYLAVISSP